MAKKDKKDKKKGGKKDKAAAGAVEAVDAVRAAVERGLAGAAEQLRGPAQELAGEIGVAANRIREVIEDRVARRAQGSAR